MSEKEKVKSEIQILRDAFEGMKGRQPRSDQELKEWLATDEGKASPRLFRASAKLGTLNDRFLRIASLIIGACACPLWVITGHSAGAIGMSAFTSSEALRIFYGLRSRHLYQNIGHG